MSTCNRLDLQTLGSQPVMPKNLPDHCGKGNKYGSGRILSTADHSVDKVNSYLITTILNI